MPRLSKKKKLSAATLRKIRADFGELLKKNPEKPPSKATIISEISAKNRSVSINEIKKALKL